MRSDYLLNLDLTFPRLPYYVDYGELISEKLNSNGIECIVNDFGDSLSICLDIREIINFKTIKLFLRILFQCTLGEYYNEGGNYDFNLYLGIRFQDLITNCFTPQVRLYGRIENNILKIRLSDGTAIEDLDYLGPFIFYHIIGFTPITTTRESFDPRKCNGKYRVEFRVCDEYSKIGVYLVIHHIKGRLEIDSPYPINMSSFNAIAERIRFFSDLLMSVPDLDHNCFDFLIPKKQ